jgi:hypothetical protein
VLLSVLGVQCRDPLGHRQSACPVADCRLKQRIGQAAYPDSFTLIDLRPIRPLVFGARHKALDADLVRVIHGFDSLMVLSGSNPSQNL